MSEHLKPTLERLEEDKILAPLCLSIYRTMQLLANEQAGRCLPPETIVPKRKNEVTVLKGKWLGTKAEAVELITALYEDGKISFDDGEATLTDLTERFEKENSIDLKDFNIIDSNNRARKKSPTPLLERLIEKYKARKTRLEQNL